MVCAVVDHGDKEVSKIVGIMKGREGNSRRETDSEQGEQEI
jgi:hypothetical protein